MFIDFHAAVEFLESRRLLTFDEALGELNGIEIAFNLSKIARHFEFNKRDEFKTLVAVFDRNKYLELVLNCICEMFPLMDEAMYEALNAGELQEFILQPMGLNTFSDEEWWDIIESVENFNIKPLELFIKFLDSDVSEEAWEAAAKYHHWPIKVMPACVGNQEFHMDLDLLKARLAVVDPRIIDLMEMATGAVLDNPFFQSIHTITRNVLVFPLMWKRPWS